MGKSKDRIPVGAKPEPLSRPFAALAGLAASLPPGPTPVAAGSGMSVEAGDGGDHAAPTTPPTPISRAKKLVVRRERKGHGGRTVTRVEGLAGTAAELEALAKQWKRAFGCGAAVEGDDVLVQGEQVDRLVAMLVAGGAKKVVTGG